VRKPFKLCVLALGAASALVASAAPAQAWGSGVDACAYLGSSQATGYSSAHAVQVWACIVDDNSYIYSTAELYNDGSTATFNVTAQLRRASDGLLIATQGCTPTVSAADYFYCTKAWPHSSTPVYTTAVVTRQPLQTQAIVSSPSYTP